MLPEAGLQTPSSPPAPARPVASQALQLLADVRSDGLAPNVVVYSSAVGACATAGEYWRVMSLLREMSAEGVEPSLETFSNALK